ncbi:MAG: hypothetical protein RBT36_07220 [Desulfobulbus sp.]|jgi:hypothetical protein|nr:hypothetical protein [Desulfobulbus sp.]
MPPPEPATDSPAAPLVELKLLVPEDLYRAFQRCVWSRINETGQTQLDFMHEVVHDFLVKHGC